MTEELFPWPLAETESLGVEPASSRLWPCTDACLIPTPPQQLTYIYHRYLRIHRTPSSTRKDVLFSQLLSPLAKWYTLLIKAMQKSAGEELAGKARQEVVEAAKKNCLTTWVTGWHEM